MTAAVHFQLLQQKDRIAGIARLLERRQKVEPKVLVLCPDALFIRHLSFQLWTISPESFLAHGVVGEGKPEAYAAQPILLSEHLDIPHAATVLMNGGLEIPPRLDGFEHIVDFVDDWDESLKQAARERFRSYRHMGYDPKYLG
jgi:DNA polymerase-3 subunit chi